MRIIDIRQRWVIVPTIWRYSAHQGISEIDCAPTADAIFRVRRDVRNVECAERRGKRETAAEAMTVLLARRGMAGRASAGIEHDAPACRIAGSVELARLLLGKGRMRCR